MIDAVAIKEGSKGPWTVSRFTIGADPTIENLRLMRDGRGVRPGTYTKLTHSSRGVVMSDTTAERHDHYPFVWKAEGHCLINGLGIGMCLSAILKLDRVNFVTVVEVDQDVIDLVWPNYKGERCDVVCASAFDYAPPKGVRYGAVWHDIWDAINEDNYDEMKRLHRKYGRRADWQGSWGRPQIERMMRQDKSRYWRW